MVKTTSRNGWTKWIIGALFTICSALASLAYDSLQSDITDLQADITKLQEAGAVMIQIQMDLVGIKGDMKSNVRERKTTDSLILHALGKIEDKMGD